MYRFNKAKRFVIRILAVAICLSFVACQQQPAANAPSQQTPTPDAAQPAADGAETSAESGGSFGKYDPPIKITYARQTRGDQVFVDNDNYDDNVWTRKYLEDIGVNLEIAWSADSQTDAFRNKMNASLVSGDIPDLFIGDFKLVSMATDAGLTADLTQVLNEYASDSLKKVIADNQLFFDQAKIDGKQVAIPLLQDPVEIQTPFLWIRQDWLDKLGLEVPKTLEEMKAVARAFVTQDPDGNGINDTYGLGVHQNLFVAEFGDIGAIASAFGAPMLASNQQGMWLRDGSGSIAYGATQPGVKEALSFVREMYVEGLIDREFGVKDVAKLEDDVNQNKIGMMYGANWNSFWPYPSVVNANPDAVFKPHPAPVADGYELKLGAPWPITEYYMVNSACENPEAIIKMLNVYDATNNDFSSAEVYAKYDDNTQFLLSPVRIANPFHLRHNEYISKAIATGDASGLPEGVKLRYDQVMSYINDKDPAGYAQCFQLGPEGTISIVNNVYIPQKSIVVTELRGVTPESWVEKAATLDKIQLQAFTEIVMGGDVSLFEKFVSDWENAGGAQVVADMNSLYK